MRFLTEGLFKHFRPNGGDDLVDRLNYYYTPCLLLLAAALVSGKQYIARPIQCWIPSQFTHSMEEYIESYCWIQNTYFLPAYERIPNDYEARENRQIGYYQWVPFILVLEAFLFTIPCIWWRSINRRSGLDLDQLIRACDDLRFISDRSEKWRQYAWIAQSMADILETQIGCASSGSTSDDGLRRSCFLWPCCVFRCRRSGCYVTIAYLMTKFFYTANAVGQFFLLNWFLKNDSYQFYGFRVLKDLMSDHEWSHSGHFPRVTLCDFEIRSVGNLNRYTVQCALTVNVFNEKIFISVWIWLCLMALITSISFVLWFFQMTIRSERTNFLADYLRTAKCASDRSRRRFHLIDLASNFDRFLDRFLKSDGVLALRMISIHAGDMITTEILKRLWKEYMEKCQYDSDHYQNGHMASNSDDDSRLINFTKETMITECDQASPSTKA